MSDETAVTIQAGGKYVTMSGREFSAATKKLSGQHSKVDAIAEVASENFTHLMRESAAEIQAAMVKAAEEAALQEGEAKFNIGFTVTLNLDQNKQTHKLAWTVRNVRETECEIPDANQENLKL